METFVSIVMLAGIGYAAYRGLKWLLRAGMLAKREEPLTPNDLKVLEESAARLIMDIRVATSECVDRIGQALADAEVRIAALEPYRQVPVASPSQQLQPVAAPGTRGIGRAPISAYQTAGTAESSAEMAKEAGLTTGEIELLKGLSQIAAR